MTALAPAEHRRDKKRGQWVEIAFGHIVLRFKRIHRGVSETSRRSLDPHRRGRGATFIADRKDYNACCEMARRILCPELYKHWSDELEDHLTAVEQVVIPPPKPKPDPESPKGPEQGSLF